ncbi:MAG: DUF1295 domain-containing protein [Chloroflexi bacterium]|nr:DUF1295 domain-containing protein [Chloroflexota bacterium]
MISELVFWRYLVWVWMALAALLFVVLLRHPAPYGRHSTSGWGLTLSARTGWLVMETPAAVLFLYWYLVGSHSGSVVAVTLLCMWESHYVHRAFVYPFSLSPRARAIPVAVVVFGFVFNVVNTYVNGRYLFHLGPDYRLDWLLDVRFVSGALLFVVGWVLNRYADAVLRRERNRSGQRYCRIDSWLFRYVCCPNYLGEIMIWIGWAVATWSLAGLSFALWTFANLAPRARAHLHWCRKHLEGYPVDRKALMPGIW